MDVLTTERLKEETLRWILSVLGAIAVYAALALVVHAVYHPDIAHLKAEAGQLLIDGDKVRPEPMEALLFRLAVLVIIPALAGFYALFSRKSWVTPLAKKPVYLVITCLVLIIIAALVYFDFAAFNPYGPKGGDLPQNKRDTYTDTNFDFYFAGIFLGQYLLVYTLVIVPLVACLFLIAIKKYQWQNKALFRIFASVFGYSILGGTILCIILMNTIYFPYSNENKLDFGAVYFAMTQVFSGAPMLVNHFMDTYGLYPQFLNPLFQITGLTVFKFTLVMSLLTGTSFCLNLYVLRKLVSNNVILFLGFTTVLFFSYLNFKFLTLFDCIYSYFPIRYLGPSLLTCLTYFYLTKKSPTLFWVTTAVAALFIIWNPEIGMVGFVSWFLVNIYNTFYAPDGTIAWKNMLLLAGKTFGTLFAVFYAYKLFIYLVYGAWPDFSLLFGTIFVFGKIGFFMLPMSPVHPWNLLAIILILGFTYSIVKWYKKAITTKSSMVLLISLIALGYFVYFQGRSQNSNFALSSGFGLLLLTILGDELWEVVKKTNQVLLNALFVVFLFMVSFSAIEIVFSSGKMVELVNQEEDKNNQSEVTDFIEKNTDFIAQHSQEHEKILVLTPRKHQALYFDGNKRLSAFYPGFVEMYYKSDLDRMESLIRDSSYNIFTELGTNMYTFMKRPLSAMAATYEYNTSIPSMAMLSKRKPGIPAKTFFTDPDRLVLHRKYSDDPAGIRLRIEDGLGIDTVSLAPQFSVQILFKSTQQIYGKAVLVGNVEVKDSITNGFAIGNLTKSPKFYFMTNGTGFTVDIPYGQLVYCVMNVFPDRMEIYQNGILMCNHALTEPMRKSHGKISVSYFDFPYFGPISEIAVANKVLDSNQVRATVRDISAYMK
jgi:hypothetical protein